MIHAESFGTLENLRNDFSGYRIILMFSMLEKENDSRDLIEQLPLVTYLNKATPSEDINSTIARLMHQPVYF
jgi:hypothetical protein